MGTVPLITFCQALSTLLFLLFALGVLEFCADRASFAQVARGLATMVLAVVGMVLVALQ
jgi:hypothetical protein